MSWVRFLFATALPISIAGQVRPSVPCDAPPALWEEVLGASVKVPREKDGKLRPPGEVTQERRERITALYRKYPDDFFVRRAYLTHTKEGVATEEVIAEFRKYAGEHPNDAGARYLHAEALTGRRTPEAIKILDELVTKDPANPWPYRMLASIYQSPRFNDRAKMKSNTQAFVDRCPDSKISAGMAINLDNSPALEKFTELLRARIEGQKDWEMVGTYGSLWRLEFKVTPAARHEEVRERVKRDLKFLESLNPAEFPETSYLREQGYELTADKAARAKMNSEVKTDSQKMPAFFRANEDFSKANPFVPPAAPREERDAYLRKQLRFLAEWVEKIPDEQFLAAQRVDLMAELKDTPAEEIVAEGRRAIRLSREKPAFVFGPRSTISGVALAWAKRGVELDAIPALVKEGEEVSEKRARANASYLESDLYASPDDAVQDENSRWSRGTVSWETLALAAFKSGRTAEARTVLSKWEAGLNDRKKRAAELSAKRAADPANKPGSSADYLIKSIGFEESRYLTAVAALARHEKRTADALAICQAAVRALSGSPGAPRELESSEPGRMAREIWKDAGGTNEGWQMWIATARPSASKEDASKWAPMTKTLPDLSALDRAGKTWTLANLKGKTTLLNVWATWCGPCRSELPHLQKLHDQIRQREDIQVVTLNVDDNIGLVEPYLKENNFTFPVLFTKEYVDALVGPLGIPTNWIADRGASLKLESVGFGGDGESWMRDTLSEIERVRGSR